MIRDGLTRSEPRKALSPDELESGGKPDVFDHLPDLPEPTRPDLSVTILERLSVPLKTILKGDSVKFPALTDGKSNAVALLSAIAGLLLIFGVQWTPSETVVMIVSVVLTLASAAWSLFFGKHTPKVPAE